MLRVNIFHLIDTEKPYEYFEHFACIAILFFFLFLFQKILVPLIIYVTWFSSNSLLIVFGGSDVVSVAGFLRQSFGNVSPYVCFIILLVRFGPAEWPPFGK